MKRIFALAIVVAFSVMVGYQPIVEAQGCCYTANKIVGGPKPSTCNAGPPSDVWVDTTVTPPQINVCGPANTWNVAGGSTGATGATGPTGPTGATGATGATGNNGTNAVAGSDTQVQFNDSGSFGASANLTFNKTSGLFGVPKLLSTSNLSNGAYIFRELRPYDYPSSPAWLESITANSSAGSTTPDHVYTAGWNLYNSGCVSSSFPGWGLSMERIWHPGGSGDAGIASIAINAGGTGYTVGDYVVVVQGGSSQNGIMKVTSVSSGVVTGFNVYQAGAGYAVANGLATLPATQANSGRYNLQTGSGTGLTFDIAAIGAPTDGGLESYFAYCNAGGGYGSRPLNFEVNFATNQAAVSFLANSVIFLTEDNLAGASFNTTRGVLNSGKLTISGSAAIGGIALDVSGNSSMSGSLAVSGEITAAASSTSNAGLRLSEGVAPTSPLVGDMWLDTSGFISYRHNPGPATDKIATDNNALTLTNKSISANQITAQTFGSGSYVFPSNLTVNGLTTKRIVFPGASGLLSGDALFCWDTSLTRLGIGTCSPSYTFDLVNTSIDVGRFSSNDGTGTSLHLNNTSTGGKDFQILSTGAGAGPGAGCLGFYGSNYNFVSCDNGGASVGTATYPTLANGLVVLGASWFKNNIQLTNIAAPSTPSSGFIKQYSDSTDLRFHDINSAGTIGTTVVASSAVSNQFMTGVSAAGVISRAQPAAANLSDGVTGSGAVVLASALPLSGTTGSIGGGLLTVGTCASGTASVTGATTSMAVSASPVTYPGDGNYWVAYVSSSNTVTVKVCATATLTPTASNYNVRVIQ